MPSAVARLVSELTEEKVRALLTELLEANQAPQPAPAVRTRRGRKPARRKVSEEQRKRYAAARKAKRDPAKKAATAPASKPAKQSKRLRITGHGGKPRKRPAPSRPANAASNRADEAWKTTAHAAISAADRLGPTAVRD